MINIIVIVIAVIAILSAVLIPTFGGIVKDAQAKADMQTARNLYVEYLAAVDGQVEDTDNDGVEEVYVVVNEGEAGKEAYFLITDGQIATSTELTSGYDVKLPVDAADDDE